MSPEERIRQLEEENEQLKTINRVMRDGDDQDPYIGGPRLPLERNLRRVNLLAWLSREKDDLEDQVRLLKAEVARLTEGYNQLSADYAPDRRILLQGRTRKRCRPSEPRLK